MTHQYIFTLYVIKNTITYQKSVSNLYEFFTKYKNYEYQLKIVDILQQPLEAEIKKIIAVPTLVKEFPYPLKRIIGDLSNPEQLHEILSSPIWCGNKLCLTPGSTI